MVGAKTLGEIIAAMVLACSGVFAQAPDGCFNYQVTGQIIFDLTGTYDDDIGLGQGVGLTMSQDAKGKVAGSGQLNIDVDGLQLVAEFEINGGVKSSGGVVSVRWSMKVKGQITDGVETLKFNVSCGLAMDVDTVNLTLVGISKCKACVGGFGCASEELTIGIGLPPAVDGTFDMDVCVSSDDGKKLVGTGMITLSNGRMINFTVKAKYKERDDATKVTMKGDPASDKGAKVKIETSGTTMTLQEGKGKSLGQKFTL